MENLNLSLTAAQYLEIKALFNAASEEGGPRPVLQNVFYSAEQDKFFCTDGRVARVHSIEWTEEQTKPETDFILKKKDFLLTKAQLKAMAFTQNVPVYSLDEQDAHLLKTIITLLTPNEDHFAQHVIGLSPEILLKLCKTFVELPSIFIFKFSQSHLGRIFVFTNNPNNFKDVPICLGVVMPLKILNTGFETGITWEKKESKERAKV